MRLTLTLFFLVLISSAFYFFSTYDSVILQKVRFKDTKFIGENLQDSVDSFKKSCPKILASEQLIFKENQSVWQDICNDIKPSLNFFIENFDIYKIHSKFFERELFTGYYEIALEGSKNKNEEFKYPLYKLPDDKSLLELSRDEIERGALSNKGFELMYVNNQAKLFFLHVQGSGKVRMENGEYIYVGFAGKNSHKYYSIGKYFLENNIFTRDTISALNIMKWLQENKDKASDIMNQNPSYIFFEIRDNSATGSLGVPLTAEASIAVDKKYYPLGVPLLLQTSLPDGSNFNNILIAQDTGSAIKGVERGDIFFGSGERAENLASDMKNSGELFLLLPKTIDPEPYF